MPIDAILFGGRRASVVPLVHEALDWEHGVFLGLDHGLGDHGGPGRRGRRAALRPDGDAAVLRLPHGRLLRPLAGGSAEREGAQLPKIFMVNWFRKDDEGRFLWPGFGENSRVLAWVFRRCDDEAEAVETPIGRLPAEGSLETEGLDVSRRGPAELLIGSTPRRGGRSCPRCASTSPSSATGCRRRSAASSPAWRSRSTEVLHRPGGPRPAQGRGAGPRIPQSAAGRAGCP